MRFFAIPFYTIILRYYLMMVVVILAGFSGLYFLALLALPIFLSAILGVSFRSAATGKAAQAPAVSDARRVELPAREAAKTGQAA